MIEHPWDEQIFSAPLAQVVDFEKQYGWFTSKRPLISCVTEENDDVKLVENLLKNVQCHEMPYLQKFITIHEIITKVLAYRTMSTGQIIEIPIETNRHAFTLEKYKVDKVFDLWNGMPAYGLLPVNAHENNTSILLYRGTDASLKRKGSWSSLISDMDMQGPGYTVYMKARDELTEWLKKCNQQNMPARVMGFSLGANLVYYTVLYDHELLAKDPMHASIAFNPPGITKKSFEIWKSQDTNEQPIVVGVVTKNDLVSLVGFLIGELYEVSTKEKRQSLHAHVELISARPAFSLTPYDLYKHKFFLRKDIDKLDK